MNFIRSILSITALSGAILSASAQGPEVTKAELAEALYSGYDFTGALSLYNELLAAETDSAAKAELSAKATLCENGIAMLRFVTEPEVATSKVVSLNDFYLYYSHLTNKSWMKIPNGFVPEGKHSINNAMLFEKNHGELIYSQPDSTGKWSLWTTTLLGDTLWSIPRPVSENITSTGDEIFPILSADGTKLYFSSNGMAGMGGYDIFVCTREKNGWSVPENLGFPYSSTADDFLFSNTPDGYYSLFASTRDCPPGSVRIYVLHAESNPVSKAVDSPDEALRISLFEKLPEPPAPASDTTEAAVPAQKSPFDDYFTAHKTLVALQDSVAAGTEILAELRSDYSNTQDAAVRAQIRSQIEEREIAQLALQGEISAKTLDIRRMESKFLGTGVVPPQILQAKPVKPEPVAEEVVKPAYRFEKHIYGTLGDVRIEMPEIEEVFDYTFKIGDVAVFAPDNKRPDGLIYQIQICATQSKLSKTRLKGMSPCFEMKQSSGKYIYFVGAFKRYADAEKALPKVKARGWSSAYITAYKDNKSISVKNARAEEARAR